MSNCCLCYPQVVGCSSTPTSKCPDGNCLRLPHLLIGSEDSVGPCGETGFIPFAGTGIDTTLCGSTTPVYSIQSHSNIFTNVTINSTGITFTTTEANGFASAGLIEYSVKCGKYASISTVTIIIKNLCASSLCPDSEYCDKCTGDCESKTGDILIEDIGGTGFNPGGVTIS